MANIIDNNTIFCLRGDSYLDISSSPMTTNSNQADFPTVTNKQLVFKGDTTDSSFTFGTTKTLPGDFTFETWFNAQSYDGFNLFANRITETCFIIGHKTATETRIGTWIGPKDNWGKPSAHYFGSITMNVNNHMAYVRKGTTHYTFLNGKLISTVDVSSPPTLGLNNFNIGQTSNFKVWNARISNVARYTADFTPDPSPYTSVAISEFSYTDGALNLAVTKNTNETIHKVEVLVNGSIIKTYDSQTLNFGDTVAVDDYLIYGTNTIEAKAYYYDDNYFINKSISVEKPIEKLTNNATFEDIMDNTNKIKSNISNMNNLLANVLTSKGISTGDNPKMFHLIKLVGQMSNTNSSEVTGYLNQISELTSQNNALTSQLSNKDLEIENNKLALVNALSSKGVDCSIDEAYSSLVSKISSFAGLKTYLYKDGVDSAGFNSAFNNGHNTHTLTKYSTYIQSNGAATNSWVALSTNATVAIKNKKYLCIEYQIATKSTLSLSNNLEVYNTKITSWTVLDNTAELVMVSFNVNSSMEVGTYTVKGDVSALNGTYSLCLRTSWGGTRITKIWLE